MTSFRVSVRKALTQMQLKEIRDAAEFAEQSVRRELRRIESNLDEVARDEGLSEDVRRELEDVYSDRARKVKSTYGHHLRDSLFLTTYSQLEVDLDELAHTLKEIHDVRLNPSELYRSGIRRSRTYFKKVLLLPFPDDKPVWSTLLGLNELRNTVAHSRNELDEGKQNAWALMEEWESIDVISENFSGDDDWTHYVVFDEGFLPQVVETIEEFWELLYEGLK